MPRAIADTGPIRHLDEIGWLRTLTIFDHLLIPNLVADELRAYRLDPENLGISRLHSTVTTIDHTEWEPVVSATAPHSIQPADAQVVVLAHTLQSQEVVLTDDLALRRVLESRGVVVVGSVGILVRAYKSGHLDRQELDHAVDALMTESTLFMSIAFKNFVYHLIANLP